MSGRKGRRGAQGRNRWITSTHSGCSGTVDPRRFGCGSDQTIACDWVDSAFFRPLAWSMQAIHSGLVIRREKTELGTPVPRCGRERIGEPEGRRAWWRSMWLPRRRPFGGHRCDVMIVAAASASIRRAATFVPRSRSKTLTTTRVAVQRVGLIDEPTTGRNRRVDQNIYRPQPPFHLSRKPANESDRCHASVPPQ